MPAHDATMSTQRLLINLQVLSTIDANDRLGTESGATFQVYRPTFYTSVLRRIKGESRALNVDRVEQLIQHALAHLRGLYGGTAAAAAATAGNRLLGVGGGERSGPTLVRHIRAAAEGLHRLTLTYRDDVSTTARIQSLLDDVAIELAELGLPE